MSADNHQESIDHYDFINAPQYVDFDDLAAQDDPHADKFFETHREEDDFMIPLDTISPTVQLLFGNESDTEHYSNQANQAAIAAGLEDVKIEYYASPPQNSGRLSQPPSGNKKSVNSMYGTPLGGSAMSSAASFYTPTGGEDKENIINAKQTPPTKSLKKAGEDSPQFHDGSESGNQRGILTERPEVADPLQPQSTGIGVTTTLPTYTVKSKSNDGYGGKVVHSLSSQLNQLCIVSSDDDDDESEPPLALRSSGSSLQEKENQSPLITGAVGATTTFSAVKMEFFGSAAAPTPSMCKVENLPGDEEIGKGETDADEDTTILGQSLEEIKHQFENDTGKSQSDLASDSDSDTTEEDRTTPIELGTPVRNILRKLDSMNLDDENGATAEEDGIRCSILVAPSVGQQVYWNANKDNPTCFRNSPQQTFASSSTTNCQNIDTGEVSGTLEWPHNFVSEGSDDELDNDNLNISSTSESTVLCSNRASSVGDLVRAIQVEPKARNFTTYGFNPRLGITIPKTPEVSGKCEIEMQDMLPEAKTCGVGNSCYFEVEAPRHPKALRRASSCSDLLALHEKPKKVIVRPRPQAIKKKPLTVPKTPEAAKRRARDSARNPVPASGSFATSKGSGQLGVQNKGSGIVDRVTTASRSRQQPVKANHYVSMAEAMIKFQKNTPDRFRSLPKGRLIPEKRERSTSCDARKRGQTPGASPDVTLTSRFRSDSFNDKKELPIKHFKSNPSGPVLPKKIELKTTIPQPFNFGATHRTKAPQVKEEVEFKFKARPAPTKSHLDNTVLLKPKMPSKVTQPMAPHFASDDRLRERHEKQAKALLKSPEPKHAKTMTVSKPSGLAAHSSRSHVDEHKTTIVQPFSSNFDARQKEMLRRKEEKMKHVAHELDEAKKGREFHANPVPKYSSKLPKKKSAEATHLEPFRLKSDTRGAVYQEAFRKKVEEEQQQLRDQAAFVAQQADVLRRPPFEPDHPSRIIEGPVDFKLATEQRAVEREVFEEQLREKSREEEERKKEEQGILEEAQHKEDLERRRQLVHKAQPFKDPKPFALKSSAKALTVPQSPAFEAMPSQRRAKSHDQ